MPARFYDSRVFFLLPLPFFFNLLLIPSYFSFLFQLLVDESNETNYAKLTNRHASMNVSIEYLVELGVISDGRQLILRTVSVSVSGGIIISSIH